jgi:hypothetical protein
MQVRLTPAMIDALKASTEMPDNLVRCIAGAQRQGDAFRVTLDDDDAMSLTEMCQWYIKKDPVTGKLGPKAEIFDGIVRSIYAAQDAP